jgi:FkbM family methyltransferase
MEYPHSALSVLPDCSAVSLEETLAELLTETVSSVQHREQNELNRLLSHHSERCVLFGAGDMGWRAQEALREIGVHPLCISDNNPELWGTWLGETQILPPQEAAARFGDSTHFFITIRNEHHWYRETFNQLSSLGCASISSAEPIAWRFSEQFPPFLAYDLPHKVFAQISHILDAANLWADEASLQEYRAQIQLRAMGNPYWLSQPAARETYILEEVFALGPRDTILDCGAFDGDTIRDLLQSGHPFSGILAVEADTYSHARLTSYVETLGSEMQGKIDLHACAVGSYSGTVCFDESGQLESRISMHGQSKVRMVPIDQLCASTRISMIKMDIEGGEFDALLGATSTIQRDRPILAVCVYHSQSDLWRLPLLIRAMCPDYRMYLRSYRGDGIQTVAYAVPPERVLS